MMIWRTKNLQISGILALATIILTTTTWFTLRRSHPNIAFELSSVALTAPLAVLKEQEAFWTTEQLRPRFAYVQYATDADYLCNAAINFARLLNFAAKEDMILIHPREWSNEDSEQNDMLKRFQDACPAVQLRPFEVVRTSKGDATWRDSLTKFHAFALVDYTRVLAFDSDSLVLNNMDHLFLAPLAPLAVPRAYWLDQIKNGVAEHVLGSHIMLLEPNKRRYEKIMQEALSSGEFDMDVMNHMFKDSAMVLPHRRIALLTGEFRASNHSRYLAPDVDEDWNAMAEVSRSLLVHFSDWPLPKPWKAHSESQWAAALPTCPDSDKGTTDRPPCADQMMWKGFYEAYAMNKKQNCHFVV